MYAALNLVCIFFKQDMQHKMKEVFRGIPDEFMTSNLASQAKVSNISEDLINNKQTLRKHRYIHVYCQDDLVFVRSQSIKGFKVKIKFELPSI